MPTKGVTLPHRTRRITVDLSGIGSRRVQEDVKARLAESGWTVKTQEGFWESMESGKTPSARKSLVILADLARVATSFRKTSRSSWHAVMASLPSVIAVVRKPGDKRWAAHVDDIVRSSGNRVDVCEYSPAHLDECLTMALKRMDPAAVSHVGYSEATETLWVEFYNGRSAAIAWKSLGLDRPGRRLRPQTAIVSDDPRTVELLDSSGKRVEIDTAVLLAMVDEGFANQLAKRAEEERTEVVDTLGAKLRAKRKAGGLTQKELDGLQQALVSKLENGKHQPTYSTLEKYAKALNLSVTELLD